MAVLFKSHGLVFESGVLAKPTGAKHDWNSNALFEVAQPACFRLTIKELNHPNSDRCALAYYAGIVRKDVKLSMSDIEEKENIGVFLDLWQHSLCDAHIGTKLESEWPLTTEREKFPHEIEMSYVDGALYLAQPGQSPTKLAANIPQGLLPCISICQPGVRLRVSMSTPARKRTLEGAGDEAIKLGRSMWYDREFADAKILCGERSIAVHRCVLAAASPFFAKAFRGQMREASQGEIVIKDAGENATEVLLQYLYTKAVPDNVDAIELLQLAHRFECAGLIEYCVTEIVESSVPSNVATNVAALRPFKDDPGIQQRWAGLCQRIASDPALVEGLMNG